MRKQSQLDNIYDNNGQEEREGEQEVQVLVPTERHAYPTRSQARQSIFEYIETFYNRQRLHSSLRYVSPLAYEQSLS